MLTKKSAIIFQFPKLTGPKDKQSLSGYFHFIKRLNDKYERIPLSC